MKLKRPIHVLKRQHNMQNCSSILDSVDTLNNSYIDDLIKNSSQPQEWYEHLVNDLLKFWDVPETSIYCKTNLFKDLFLTYWDNKGMFIPEEKDWPEEYKAAAADDDLKGLVNTYGINYVRAHSRQTFAYGIAYHMTGDVKYLGYCKKGTASLIKSIDAGYGMFTKQDGITGEWQPEREERTSQDLAYGLTGLSMYYYLTHDENILYMILQIKDYIFNAYFDRGKGYLTWYPRYMDDGDVEIVAQLDQMYAYMLFLIPSLPEPYQSQWKMDLKMLVDLLFHRFYSQRYEFFWGVDSTSTDHQLGKDHTDFGHAVKTMWNIYRAGVLLKDSFYIMFAREKIDNILNEAFIPKTGSWGRRYDPYGNVDPDKEWWIYAELDQAAALLALNDPTYLTYLNPAHQYWMDYMVDHKYGEIWHMVSAKDNRPIIKYPKIHNWKTSLHSFEHALFNYMTSSQIHNEKFQLFYAFTTDAGISFGTSPYMFEGNIKNVTMGDWINICGLENHRKTIVVYDNIR